MYTLLGFALIALSAPVQAAPRGGPHACDTDDLLVAYLGLFNDRAADWTHVISPAYVVESPYGTFDLAGWQALTAGAWYALPDIRWSNERVVVDDDRIALEYSFVGTFQNDFMGYVAYGQPVAGRGMEMHAIDRDECRITRTWNYSDAFGFFSQLQ